MCAGYGGRRGSKRIARTVLARARRLDRGRRRTRTGGEPPVGEGAAEQAPELAVDRAPVSTNSTLLSLRLPVSGGGGLGGGEGERERRGEERSTFLHFAGKGLVRALGLSW